MARLRAWECNAARLFDAVAPAAHEFMATDRSVSGKVEFDAMGQANCIAYGTHVYSTPKDAPVEGAAAAAAGLCSPLPVLRIVCAAAGAAGR
eukprot:gene8677-4664_t